MKKSIILYILAGIIIIASLVKIFINRQESKKTLIASEAPVFPAEGYIVKDTVVNYTINTIGTLRANESVSIESEINRRLVSIKFKEGTYIKKGTLLFKLDDADLTAQLNKLTLQENLAVQNEKRNRALLEQGGISQQVFDDVLNHLKTVQADIEIIKVNLDKTEIKAPFSGIIGLRYVSEGAYLTPNKALTTLQDISSIKIDFSVPERYANSLKRGMDVTFTISSDTRTFSAEISAIQPDINKSTRTVQIMAVADNSEGLLYPGSSARVLLDFQEKDSSIFIPTQCLLPSLKGYSVYKLENGKAGLNHVNTGIRTKESVQLLEGVKTGDTLVMTNLLRIKPGSKVKINKLY
ncbi:efflux RND transporter periplasmic adaptor subunit [candidate division KSB1 bacterium]